MPTRQAKHWCFTINNYDDDIVRSVRDASITDGVVYLVFGREVGESGTPHLQGYVSFRKRVAFGHVKSLFGAKAHLEPARGNPTQASTYCKKDGDFEEFGELPGGSGQRTDLIAVAEAIKQGETLRAISERYPAAVLRYGSGVQRLRAHYRPSRDQAPEIQCFWGPTGCGKTRRVWEFVKHDELWLHPGGQWFDGYDGHRSVLFDDFDGSWFKLHYLLKLLDRYPMPVPVKGGFTWWVPKHIFITSNVQPREWYNNAHEEHKRALMRRLNEFGTIVQCFHVV